MILKCSHSVMMMFHHAYRTCLVHDTVVHNCAFDATHLFFGMILETVESRKNSSACSHGSCIQANHYVSKQLSPSCTVYTVHQCFFSLESFCSMSILNTSEQLFTCRTSIVAYITHEKKNKTPIVTSYKKSKYSTSYPISE